MDILFGITVAGAATAPPGLSAHDIMSRWAAASGVTAENSRSSVQRYEEIYYGKTFYATVISEAPNKVYMRSDYRWRHLVTYQGYDGTTAWTSTNFGAGAPAGPGEKESIVSDAAWYNDADILRGRADVHMERVPDITINGKTYYAIERSTTGGAADTVLIDKATFFETGFRYAGTPNRYDMCADFARADGVLFCQRETIFEDGKTVGSVYRLDVPPDQQTVNESQFAAPSIPNDDGTTSALVVKYAAALGAATLRANYSLVGDERLTYFNRPGVFFPYQWQLDVSPPMQYTLTNISRTGRKYVAGFDGTTGYFQSYNGAKTDRTYIMGIRGPLLAHCAAQPSACNLVVRHLPDVDWAGTTYVALGVWSARDPSQHYTLLLDPATFLPYAANVYQSTAYFEDFVRSPSGVTYPTELRQEDLWDDDDVSNIRLLPPSV